MFENNLQSVIFFWNEDSFVPVRVLHKDEKIFGMKTYLFTACAECYLRFWCKVIFKTGNIPSTWSWLNAFVQFEWFNARIQQLTWSLIFYEKYSTSQSDLWFWNFHWPDKKIHWPRAIGPPLILNTAYITSIGALSTPLLAAKFPG